MSGNNCKYVVIDLVEYGINTQVSGSLVKNGKYYGIKGKRAEILLHRIVVMKYLGITTGIQDFVVHHIDGDTSNNHINNLLLMSEEDHSMLHFLENTNRIDETWEIIQNWRDIMEGVRQGRRYLLSVHSNSSVY
jgi:hypothetical protein